MCKKLTSVKLTSGSRFITRFTVQDSASGSVFRVLFKIRPAYYSASGSGFSVLLKNVQGIIQRIVQDPAYYSKMSKVLFSVWFNIQRIIKKSPRY